MIHDQHLVDRLSRFPTEPFQGDVFRATRYGDRDYAPTQRIGAALAFLGLDGLMAPSARWSCDNLMIFADNHQPTARLESVSDEQIEWSEWAQTNGFIPG